MPDTTKDKSSVKKKMHFFYVLDKSGSMDGAPISTLNSAMRETIEVLKDVQKANSTSADFEISVLVYDNDAEWTSEPMNIDDFRWRDIEAYGGTELSVALKKLNEGLSRRTRLDHVLGNKNPMIIFMSDGMPFPGWERELENLKNNHWYNPAIKIAFALDHDMNESADVESLRALVGSEGAVIKTSDLETFRKLIKVVSATGSRAGLSSDVVKHDSDSIKSGASIAHAVMEQAKTDSGMATGNVELTPTESAGTVITFGG